MLRPSTRRPVGQTSGRSRADGALQCVCSQLSSAHRHRPSGASAHGAARCLLPTCHCPAEPSWARSWPSVSGCEGVQPVHMCEPQPRLGEVSCQAPCFKMCLLMCLFIWLVCCFYKYLSVLSHGHSLGGGENGRGGRDVRGELTGKGSRGGGPSHSGRHGGSRAGDPRKRDRRPGPGPPSMVQKWARMSWHCESHVPSVE